MVLKLLNVGILRSAGGRLFHKVEPRKIALFLKVSLFGKGMFSTGPSCNLVRPSVLSTYTSFLERLYINFSKCESALSLSLFMPVNLCISLLSTLTIYPFCSPPPPLSD